MSGVYSRVAFILASRMVQAGLPQELLDMFVDELQAGKESKHLDSSSKKSFRLARFHGLSVIVPDATFSPRLFLRTLAGKVCIRMSRSCWRYSIPSFLLVGSLIT
ncbi:hypothetical protein GALMADRAFT_428023 [Galerina marginata CBS 339.88]|uniref:Uncharacterized protein n=1 Tax=Galerina marginata (strain CBS 339.88) TaxID=685588 RepID=A0A067T1S8_GALM3|nr:hypothetical protein GALMADRAFT_428023 [Galerina marginata CBS 339.88]